VLPALLPIIPPQPATFPLVNRRSARAASPYALRLASRVPRSDQQERRHVEIAVDPVAIVLGFAFGGFFDGILLHQILQWRHLLSLAPGVSDMRLQVLWDGYFHALVYVIAALAPWGLWRARKHAGEAWGRPLFGALLVGFGVWHIVDSVASHWVLGIHRIKLDSPNPLMWDLVWFSVFGAIPFVLGLLLRRGDVIPRAPSKAPPGRSSFLSA
jgi:uncharacterized membrane protein